MCKNLSYTFFFSRLSFFFLVIVFFFSETYCRNTHNVPTQRDAHFKKKKKIYIYICDRLKKKKKRTSPNVLFFFSELRWVSATSHNRFSHKILLFFFLLSSSLLFSLKKLIITSCSVEETKTNVNNSSNRK